MSNSKITALTSYTNPDATQDVLPIVDVGNGMTKKITRDSLLGITSAPTGISDSQTLSNKTLTNPTINAATLSGTIAGTYTIGGTPTFPATVVTTTASQTLTNKVLTSPVVNTATIANPTLTVDSIAEYTGANGVTIDGLSIKDSALNTANSVVTTNITDDAVTAAKMLNGQIYKRRGGSATVWGTAGTTDYDVSASDVRIQCGTTANSGSPTAHTFPTAYTYAPVVVANVVTAVGANTFAVVSSVTTTGFSCQVVTDAGVANTGQTINWIAIGI
jgi:hypothetical protein